MEKLYTTAYAEEVKNEDGSQEKLFVASDETLDRQGEIVAVDGWKLENFKRNPVILWGHDQSQPAIGRAAKIGYKTINGKKKLVFQPEFHKKDDRSRLIASLVEEDFIKTTSVGFKPLEGEGNKITAQELLEVSFVNVPANPNATQFALAKGYTGETIKEVMPDAEIEDIKEVEEKVDKTQELAEKVESLTETMKTLEKEWNIVKSSKEDKGREPIVASNEVCRSIALKALNKALHIINQTKD